MNPARESNYGSGGSSARVCAADLLHQCLGCSGSGCQEPEPKEDVPSQKWVRFWWYPEASSVGGERFQPQRKKKHRLSRAFMMLSWLLEQGQLFACVRRESLFCQGHVSPMATFGGLLGVSLLFSDYLQDRTKIIPYSWQVVAALWEMSIGLSVRIGWRKTNMQDLPIFGNSMQFKHVEDDWSIRTNRGFNGFKPKSKMGYTNI